MKRPGEPKQPKKRGGKALERVKQFHQQRGLPVEPPKGTGKEKPGKSRGKG